MARYSNSVAGQNLSTANDLRTLVTTATGAGSAIALYELLLNGEESASSVARVAINRPGTAGITQNTAQTPEKLHPASAAAAFSVTALAGWTTQPVLSTNDVAEVGFNAFGGIARWVAIPGSEIIVGTQGAVANLSIRSRSGTGVVSGHILTEQY